MLEQPKVQYRFQKHQEYYVDTIRMTFRFLMYESFENLSNIEPFSEKSKHTQEVTAEMLKQLYRYAIRTAMSHIEKLNDKHGVAAYLEILDTLAYRKKLFGEMGHQEEWADEFSEDLLFLRTVRENLETKVKELDKEIQMQKEVSAYVPGNRQ